MILTNKGHKLYWKQGVLEHHKKPVSNMNVIVFDNVCFQPFIIWTSTALKKKSKKLYSFRHYNFNVSFNKLLFCQIFDVQIDISI